MECEAVLDGLLARALGPAGGPRRLAADQHIAVCATCRAEAERLALLLAAGAADAEGRVEALCLEDAEGGGQAFYASTERHADPVPRAQWSTNTGADPDTVLCLDAQGQALAEADRRRLADGRWALRFALPRPWAAGEELRLALRLPMRLRVDRSGTTRVASWRERPLESGSGRAALRCHRLLQLAPGQRAATAEPAPDAVLANGRLLAWRVLVPAGEVFSTIVTMRIASAGAAPVRARSRAWRWSRPEAADLVELRRRCALDAVVAGAATELDAVVAVCHFVHGLWRHNGAAEPSRPDPLGILNEVARGRAFRCVEYAIVIAGCLQALGLPARTVNLMTRDVETRAFGAGHVVAEAFLRSSGRWVLADGQWDAVPTLAGLPLDAVAFSAALARRERSLDVLGTARLAEYGPWVAPYLHFIAVPLDCRVEDGPRAEDRLMFVPPGSSPPRLFQRVQRLSGLSYTADATDLYPLPG